MANRYRFLSQSPIVNEGGWGIARAFPKPDEKPDLPETSRMVDGEEYTTVSEWLRRYDPIQYPVVDELISASGFDRTYVVLGKMAAERGRLMQVNPVKMHHPDYGYVNGWPYEIIRDAFYTFRNRYDIRWLDRDPIAPTEHEPVAMPPMPYNPALYAQIRNALAARGKELKAARDPRWRGAYAMMLEQRDGETPQQALIRRNSAASVMYAIEMEYETR